MASEDQATVILHAAMLTDVGVVREHNEDSVYVDTENRFFIVADGMGGHAAGEVASAMAVDTVRETLDNAGDDISGFAEKPEEEGRKELVTLLETAVRAAHRSVFERGSRETDKQGMGTTLEVVLVAGAEAFIAHVGDSRTYLMRDGRASQITTDHTVAEVLVLEGKLSAEEAQNSPLRTILVNAIGVAPDVGIEMAHVQLREGDQILLCSDGLHDYFPAEQELADRLHARTPKEALADLIGLAKERGGHDNITGVVVHVAGAKGVPGSSPASVKINSIPASIDDEPLSDGVPSTHEEDDDAEADTGPVDVDDASAFPNLLNVSVLDDELTQDDIKPPANLRGVGTDEGADTTKDVRGADTDDLATEKIGADDAKDDTAHRPTQPMAVVIPDEES